MGFGKIAGAGGRLDREGRMPIRCPCRTGHASFLTAEERIRYTES
ncbi:MAG: hypothetical protein HSCHL_0788 [Hydrogenibacillus schlegelii]|uniref:Uncharacterized protein n=1 Tax=Hydrogenibacillus schlegelii TaxID=1484 RepID=A0A2T5GD75_HYDSH|nr:MAG: hypothetical protein HSCHL_0788 [Hydrogenibacillus schlegelii]